MTWNNRTEQKSRQSKVVSKTQVVRFSLPSSTNLPSSLILLLLAALLLLLVRELFGGMFGFADTDDPLDAEVEDCGDQREAKTHDDQDLGDRDLVLWGDDVLMMLLR